MERKPSGEHSMLILIGACLCGVGLAAIAASILAPGFDPRPAIPALLGGVAFTVVGLILCLLAWRLTRRGGKADEGHTRSYVIMRCNGIVLMVGGVVFGLFGCSAWWEGAVGGGAIFLPGLAAFLLASRFEAWERRRSGGGPRATGGGSGALCP